MSSSYTTSSSHAQYYAPAPKCAPWPAGSQNPRSVPTPPISGHPTKKSRVGTPDPSYYHRKNSEGRSASPRNANSPSAREKPRGMYELDFTGGYYQAEAHQMSAGASSDDCWYREGDGHSRRSSAGGNYSTKPARTYANTTPPQEYAYNETQFSDSGDSRDAQTETGTQYITRRSHSAYPDVTSDVHDDSGRWVHRTPSLGFPATGNETSIIAAREALTELFPELEEPYNTSPIDRDGRARYYPQQQQSYVSPPRRYAQIDPSLHGDSTSPYRNSGARSPPLSRDDRPRDYTTVTPESLYPLSARSPSVHYASGSYTYQNGPQSRALEPDYNLGDFNDSDIDYYYDETDDEDDDNLSITPIGASPFYTESSVSPERDTHESIDSTSSRYPSREVIHSSSSSSHPRNQSMPSTTGKSTTSTGPRRTRKPLPNPDAAAIAANSPATTEKYDQNDKLLIYYRRQGVSYKTIKTKLNLDEAESTLRGRYRTLTKPKNERLRKPTWSEADIKLLLEIVDPDLPQIKWKLVSDLIVHQGGSYKFGSSTCKKQYLALVQEGRAAPLNECGAASKRRKHRVGPTHKD